MVRLSVAKPSFSMCLKCDPILNNKTCILHGFSLREHIIRQRFCKFTLNAVFCIAKLILYIVNWLLLFSGPVHYCPCYAVNDGLLDRYNSALLPKEENTLIWDENFSVCLYNMFSLITPDESWWHILALESMKFSKSPLNYLTLAYIRLIFKSY